MLEADAIAIAAGPGVLQGQVTGEHAAADQTGLKTRALLVGPVHHRQVARRCFAALAQLASQAGHRDCAGQYAIDPIETPGTRLAVQMRTTQHVGRFWIKGDQTEHVTHCIHTHVKTAFSQPGREQVAHGAVFGRGGEAMQPTGLGRADGRGVAEQRLEGFKVLFTGHQQLRGKGYRHGLAPGGSQSRWTAHDW